MYYAARTVSTAIRFVRTPAWVDLISTVTLSVSTITMTSSTSILSPSFFAHEAMVPSVIDSPNAGTFSTTGFATKLELWKSLARQANLPIEIALRIANKAMHLHQMRTTIGRVPVWKSLLAAVRK
jgi:hypothetical protein